MVEFALAIPLVFLLFLALFDFGRAVYALNSISNAAREGARVAIVDQGPPTGVSKAAQEAANQATGLGLDPANVNDVRVQYLLPDLSAPCPGHGVGCVAEVRVQYRFQPIVTTLVTGPITLSTTTQIPIERTFQSP